MRGDTQDYRALFLADTPMMDMRAPVEFARGAFPHAVNLPLMTDSEREAVGTCYARQGQQAAIALGHKLVSGAVRDERIAAWVRFARRHPDGYLYCFRGGLRSQIAQQWLAQAGIDYPRVAGGYKALRAYLAGVMAQAFQTGRFVLVGGLTGSGKTALLHELEHAIDLEGLAHHRGSSFGRHATPQPTQIDFENALAIALLKKQALGLRELALEEEGRMIGSCNLPLPLRDGMQRYPLVWLDEDLSARTDRILRDYVLDLSGEFVALHGPEAGMAAFSDHLLAGLARIARRLGEERYRQLAAHMRQALKSQAAGNGTASHRVWIDQLLRHYYDPMYAYQRRQRQDRIIFSGNRREVRDYLRRRLV
ncbi:tRNA 2-selenouridine(34) synthase MnmH [Allopusillimonas soli]|uniref:tRNA 2-selenouridine synthase n=1 Tax=Allopusillimonas soli TaxID=659016 RepID=A0A853FH92_9BURK|nr:tRNA 2-selenouridine(34) synthase MnmH [Allopusillimonas soli]NYT37811.1 tRNA 2-selenouridine(34) synthase MnmH [Allopusillimonas soli]TEA73719.1 tRNA 2-selenouridine(34) synthase MnmH [Allopusillimonas soli]